MAHGSPDHIDEIIILTKAPPGTELLYDPGNKRDSFSRHLHQLQHVKSGDTHVLLVPQPSITDLNDPLRWSAAKKWVTLLNGLWFSFNGAVTGPIMAAGMLGLSATFDVSLQKLTYANGATLICQGVGTVFWMPFVVKYGRRPVYLLSSLLTMVACIWLGAVSTKTYAPFIIGRAFLGLFEAPIESIVPSTITDIFFLHERGAKVSLYGLSVLGGNELGPMLSAFIIQSLGMNWAFYIVGIFIAANFVTIFFTMPESKYIGVRPSIILQATGTTEKDQASTKDEKEPLEEFDPSKRPPTTETIPLIPKKRYLQSLAVWSTGDPNVSLRQAFLRPFVLLAYPTVVWSCVIYGLALGWNVVLGATVAQLFGSPPYSFDSSAQGLIFLSPFVGSLIGTYLCGPFADWTAQWYTKRNRGIREPEMRLPTCVIAALVTFLGALMAGLSYHNKTHWAVPVVGFGILSLGAQMGATLAMTYALDCHKELSVELMVTVSSLKSAIAWIWTWVINDWIDKDGMMVVFMVIATVNVVAYLITILFYLKGKEIRARIYETDLLGRARLR